MQQSRKMTGEHASVIYGTHYPNRLFVGCLPSDAGAEDLGNFFAKYGNVVEAKIVLDHDGNSKRFGFVTFSNPEEVESLIACGDIHFKGKKINVGPAVKKNIRSTSCEVQDTTVKKVLANQANRTQKAIGPPPTTQHIPKTVIRRSPVDSILHVNNPEDTSFQYIWGISNPPNSVWSPSYGQKNRGASGVERPLCFYDQLQDMKQDRLRRMFSSRASINSPTSSSSSASSFGSLHECDIRSARNYMGNNFVAASSSYRGSSLPTSSSARTPLAPQMRIPPGFPPHPVSFLND